MKVLYIYIYNISLSLRNFLGLYFLYYIYYIYNINLFCKNRACCILYLYNIHPNINPENRKEREKNCNCYNSNRLTFYNFLYTYLKKHIFAFFLSFFFIILPLFWALIILALFSRFLLFFSAPKYH